MIIVIITAVVALIIGGLCGFLIFRFVIKGKYNEMVSAAQKEAEVIKEKKLLEVKEKFLNKKSELEKISTSLIVSSEVGDYGAQVLVNDRHAAAKLYPGMVIEPAPLEEIMIYYVNRARG